MKVVMKKNLSRRRFLRGLGAAMALPLLDAMHHRGNGQDRKAQPHSPIRTGFFYIPNGVVQSAWNPDVTKQDKALSVPLKLTRSLEPLKKVRDKVVMLTNLDRVKVAGTDGHAQASTCWLTSAAPDELSPAGYPLKKTVDQMIAAVQGKNTAFRSLELSCNPYLDNKESVYFDNISWYGHGHVARSTRDPSKVFNRLFKVDDKRTAASVLDLIQEDAKQLQRELGSRDNRKLDEYLDSVRTVERQIQMVEKRQLEFEKMKLTEPVKIWQSMARDEFIQVMGDLMILAFQTDLTRVATLMTAPERWSTPLKVDGVFEKPIQHHSWTHNQGNEQVRKDLETLDRFHVAQFSAPVAKMEKIKEGEGSLLDNMTFTLGSGLSSGELHVTNNLPTIVAGSAGGKIRSGRLLHSPKGTPIANLWMSLCEFAGAKQKRIGDCTGSLRGL